MDKKHIIEFFHNEGLKSGEINACQHFEEPFEVTRLDLI